MSDSEIRRDIQSRLASAGWMASGAILVEELEVESGRARIDMALISRRLIGIEIKGPRDTLRRLPRQIEHYSNCFDHVVLVVDERLAMSAASIVPEWWGIVTVNRDAAIQRYEFTRMPKRNPGVRVGSVLSLLWRNEIETLWHKHTTLPIPLRASRRSLRAALLESSAAAALRRDALDMLKSRKDWRGSPA